MRIVRRAVKSNVDFEMHARELFKLLFSFVICFFVALECVMIYSVFEKKFDLWLARIRDAFSDVRILSCDFYQH